MATTTTANTWKNSDSPSNYQVRGDGEASRELVNGSESSSNLMDSQTSDVTRSSPPPLPPPPLPPPPATTTTTTNSELITDPVLSVRMLMTSKDVGSVIGKGGMTIKAIREQSGAKINISNGTASERLVTVTGSEDNICKAFTAISGKIQDDMTGSTMGSSHQGGTVIMFKLIIQSSQCGSLIGKGGAKIKEIRENTGASVQVAGEALPNSTERAVTVSGTSDAISLCLQLICKVMLDNPPKGPFLPYKPHALPNQPYQPKTPMVYQAPYTATFHSGAAPATTTQHMRIPNDLIGCVIGRKGSKIHEIRVNSGAQIKIAGNEGDGSDRLVTITGTPEAVGMAQYLINSRIHSEVNSFLSIGMNTAV